VRREGVDQAHHDQHHFIDRQHRAFAEPIDHITQQRAHEHTQGRGDEVQQGDGRHRHLVQGDQHPGAEDQEDLLADAEQGADRVEDPVLPAIDHSSRRRVLLADGQA